MNATDYITKFKILISKSKIKGNNAKVTFFQKGLNPALCTKIYSTFPLPEIFEEWCERAAAMDAQWRASNTSTPGNHSRSSNWRNHSNTTQVRAVNLSFQECQKYSGTQKECRWHCGPDHDPMFFQSCYVIFLGVLHHGIGLYVMSMKVSLGL